MPGGPPAGAAAGRCPHRLGRGLGRAVPRPGTRGARSAGAPRKTRNRGVPADFSTEFAIAALRARSGWTATASVGTSLVTGSGAPTANMVYKLVEVDGIPVAESAAATKETHGPGRKSGPLRAGPAPTGTITEEIRVSGRPAAGHPAIRAGVLTDAAGFAAADHGGRTGLGRGAQAW